MKNWLSIALLFISSISWEQSKVDFNDLQNLFWKVTPPNGGQSNYVFGTIHLIDRDNFFLPTEIERLLVQSDVLYLEIENLSNATKARKLAFLPEGRMTDLLTTEQRDSVYSFIESELGMDSARYEKLLGKLKPIAFSQVGMPSKMGNMESYDATFNRLAKKNKVTTKGLETIEEQFTYFDEMPKELQVELIMQTVRQSADYIEEWSKMQNAYLNQELAVLVDLSSSSSAMELYMQDRLMNQRNANWMHKLEKSLNEGNTFIAVGAAHLTGEKGILSLFEKQGFVIEPISIQLRK